VSFENAFNNIDRVMRNDEGLASELDYAEQTSWLLFLKYLDDLETERADRAALENRDYTPILIAPFRWGTWAAPKKDGQFDHQAAMTGCGPDRVRQQPALVVPQEIPRQRRERRQPGIQDRRNLLGNRQQVPLRLHAARRHRHRRPA
jgi:hypothetical protein